ncbi:apolipoprotein D [Oryzias latipes]|uniref:Apolipoprotein D n=1 Tax=Oryzias latipes TaxID=8090 RepID=H2MD13_ORYLA|nr:apolipoprotein D [Oryzias latipes]
MKDLGAISIPHTSLQPPPDISTPLRAALTPPPAMSASLVLLLLLPLVSAQTFGWGPCKTPEVQANFTLEEFAGSWYLVEKLPAFFAPGKCIRSNLTLMENDTVHVTSSHFFFDREWRFEGVLVTPDGDEPAKLAAHFFKFAPSMPDWVLATDYTDYSVVYSCMDFFHAFHLEYAWIFSRSPSLSPETLRHCEEILDREGIDTSRLQEVEQDCTDVPKKSFSY